MDDNLRAYFSEIGQKGGQASARVRGQAASRENSFQQLFQRFLTQPELLTSLLKEYPGTINQFETQGELEKWLEAAFRLRADYQEKVRALLSKQGFHQSNGDHDEEKED